MQSPRFLTSTSSNNNTKDKKASSHLKVLIMNCQSIIGKRAIFDNLIDCYKPEIVVGTEPWLKPSISNSEVFPTSFQVFRRDRLISHGGVFIACDKTLNWQEIPLETDCETVAIKLTNSGCQTLIVIVWYRPPIVIIAIWNP